MWDTMVGAVLLLFRKKDFLHTLLQSDIQPAYTLLLHYDNHTNLVQLCGLLKQCVYKYIYYP